MYLCVNNTESTDSVLLILFPRQRKQYNTRKSTRISGAIWVP